MALLPELLPLTTAELLQPTTAERPLPTVTPVLSEPLAVTMATAQ